MPCSIPSHRGLRVGLKIQILGFVNPLATNFSVNLQAYTSNPTIYPDQVALHYNPRYYEYPNFVAINSRTNGVWSQEVRSNGTKIGPGSIFELLIVCDLLQFYVTKRFYLLCNFSFGIVTSWNGKGFTEHGLLDYM